MPRSAEISLLLRDWFERLEEPFSSLYYDLELDFSEELSTYYPADAVFGSCIFICY